MNEHIDGESDDLEIKVAVMVCIDESRKSLTRGVARNMIGGGGGGGINLN